jgi:hypothetical protein
VLGGQEKKKPRWRKMPGEQVPVPVEIIMIIIIIPRAQKERERKNIHSPRSALYGLQRVPWAWRKKNCSPDTREKKNLGDEGMTREPDRKKIPELGKNTCTPERIFFWYLGHHSRGQ